METYRVFKNKKFIFIKKEIDTYDLIPHGIEDFRSFQSVIFGTTIFFQGLSKVNFSKKILIKKKGKISDNCERKNL